MRTLAILTLLVACGGGGNDAAPDAVVATDAPSSTPDAKVQTGTAKNHTLWINTEGGMVAPGADDATLDKSAIASHAATVKAFLVGDASRAATIAQIVGQVTALFAPYDITVVTTRPTTGKYDEMLVTDDSATVIGLPAGAPAVTPTNCNDSASVISFQFGFSPGTAKTRVVNTVVNDAVGMYGLSRGVPFSSKPGDCACIGNSACSAMFGAVACTIGGAGTPIDTSNGGVASCSAAGTTMDEGALYLAAFGAH